MPSVEAYELGSFLRARRARLDPAALGYPLRRRRTPGLRREEVAQRADISATWYTWLEQGRGGAPSTHVLERIAGALMLTAVEREHLFLLALGHLPEAHPQEIESVTPRLQRVLDALGSNPAVVKTSTWDVVAWNLAAVAVFGDYGSGKERNVLRRIFSDPGARSAHIAWESVARSVVATFRADAVRAADKARVQALVDELSQMSPEFEAMWKENDVLSHGEGTKRLHHPDAGLISLEYSSFAVDGRPELGMVVYNPATAKDAELIRSLIASRQG